MPDEQPLANSPRAERLAAKFADKSYRDSYVVHHTRQFLSRQVRAVRGDRTQQQFGRDIGKPQSVVARLENPNYGKWALQSAFDIAAKNDLAVIVRFVDFGTFLRLTGDTSDAAVRPAPFSQEMVESVAEEERAEIAEGH